MFQTKDAKMCTQVVTMWPCGSACNISTIRKSIGIILFNFASWLLEPSKPEFKLNNLALQHVIWLYANDIMSVFGVMVDCKSSIQTLTLRRHCYLLCQRSLSNLYRKRVWIINCVSVVEGLLAGVFDMLIPSKSELCAQFLFNSIMSNKADRK